MPNIIVINGIIGLDVTANDVRKQLEAANGQPIEAEIGSPGGLIVQGIEIYNLFRRYPGKKTARIMGMAASMSAIIPLAFDTIEAYSNSIYFVHQAITTVSDANKDDLQYRIGVLTGFDNILISALIKKSGRKREDIETLMKNETFIFGSEIKENGFADIIIDSGEEIEQELAVTNAMSEFYACQEKIKTKDHQIDKIAAYLNKSVLTTPERPAFSNHTREVKSMDLNKLKAEHQDVYQAAIDEGKKLGIEASKETHLAEGEAKGQILERKRISEIKALALPGQESIMNAMIEDGTKPEQAAVKFLAAQKESLLKIKNGIENDLQDGIDTDVPVTPKKPEEEASDPVKEFNALVDVKVKSGMKKSIAIQESIKEKPELHQAYVNALSGGK